MMLFWFTVGKMLILFFDTETNGLPVGRNSSNPADWPDIIQIAWQLWDYKVMSAPSLVERANYIIKPRDDIVWSEEAAAVHGISYERAQREGVEFVTVLGAWFCDAARRANVIVAHNLQFDEAIVKNACLRAGIDHSTWWPRNSYCTLKTSTLLCKIPGKNMKRPSLEPFKYPRLAELYVKLYGNESNLRFHDAGEDVECLVQCFQELMRLRRVPTYEWSLPDLRVIRLF